MKDNNYNTAFTKYDAADFQNKTINGVTYSFTNHIELSFSDDSKLTFANISNNHPFLKCDVCYSVLQTYMDNNDKIVNERTYYSVSVAPGATAS